MALCNILEQRSSLGYWSLNPTAACLYSLCQSRLVETRECSAGGWGGNFGRWNSILGVCAQRHRWVTLCMKWPVSKQQTSHVASTGEKAQSIGKHSVLILYKWPIFHVKCVEKVDGRSDSNLNPKNKCLWGLGIEPKIQNEVFALYSLYSVFDQIVPSFMLFYLTQRCCINV